MIVDGAPVRFVIHSFTAEKAVIEELTTGKVLVVPAENLTFDPPTEIMLYQSQRAQAAGSPPPLKPL
jgi:hypothetical protein